MSACPTGCGYHVKPGHLLCALCWHLVPKPLQGDVMRTWRALRSASLGDFGARRSDYEKAVELATNAARERQIKRELRT